MTLLLAAIVYGASAHATTKTVKVQTPGTLSQLISSSEKASITDLTVIGQINDADLRFLQFMCQAAYCSSPWRKNRQESYDTFEGSLTTLNLENAEIIGGGSVYTYFPDDDSDPCYLSTVYANTIAATAFSYSILVDVTLPQTLEEIGSDAFAECKSLVSVSIPKGSIGSEAFYDCPALATVNLSDGVEGIRDYAFDKCEKLKFLYIPASASSIRDNAFVKSSIENFVVDADNANYSSKNGALYNKDQSVLLKYNKRGKLTLPSSVKYIGKYAFYDSPLSSIEISDNVVGTWNSYGCYEEIDIGVFGCDNLASLKVNTDKRLIVRGIDFCGKNAKELSLDLNAPFIGRSYDSNTDYYHVYDITHNVTSVALGRKVKEIGAYMFEGEVNIKNFTCNSYFQPKHGECALAFNLKTLDYNDEEGTCLQPTATLHIPYGADYSGFDSKGETSFLFLDNGIDKSGEGLGNNLIPYSGFAQTGTFESHDFASGGISYFVSDSAAYAVYGSSAGRTPSSASLPSQVVHNDTTYAVKGVFNYAFENCASLERVDIPASCDFVKPYAFRDCGKLNTVSFAGTLEEWIARPLSPRIDGYTLFIGGKAVTGVALPDTTTSLAKGKFYGCTSLRSVSIPKHVTAIGADCLTGCTALTDIYDYARTPQNLDSIHIGDLTDVTLHVPTDKMEAYRNATGWRDAKAIVGDIVINASKLTLSSHVLSMPYHGKSTLSATATPDDATNVKLVWRSSDATVATVDQAGNVGTLYDGTATIYAFIATDSTVFDSCVVTIARNAVGNSHADSMQNVAYMEDVSVRANSYVTVSVRLNSEKALGGFQFDVSLPEGVSFAKDEDGNCLYKVGSDLNWSSSLAVNLQADGTLRIVDYSSNTQPVSLAGKGSELVMLTLNVDKDIEPNDFPLTLKNVSLSDCDGNLVMKGGTVVSTLHVLNPFSYKVEKGDANNDGLVNATDLVTIFNKILNKPVYVFVEDVADMDGNEEIMVNDIVLLKNAILYGQRTLPTAVWRTSAAGGEGSFNNLTMSFAPFTISPGEEKTVSLNLTNRSLAVAGYSVDIEMPAGLTITAVANGERAASFTTEGNYQSDGRYRLLSVSLDADSRTYTGDEGEVARLTIKADKELAPNQRLAYTLANIHLSSIEGFDYGVRDVTDSLTIGGPLFDGVVIDEDATTAPTASDGAVNVQVRRTIRPGRWSTICLPFALTEGQVEEAFGADVQLADYTGWDGVYASDDDENPSAITVNFRRLGAGEGMEANHPYLIKVSEDVSEFVVEGVTVAPKDAPSVTTGSRRRGTLGSFVGTYTAGFTVPEATLFLSGGEFWYSTGKTKMKGLRAYFDLLAVLQSYFDGASELEAKVSVSFDGTTDIGPLPAGYPVPGRVYSLDGRMVSQHGTTGLPKGVYVGNGKKFVVK